jgi:hypothetical protein
LLRRRTQRNLHDNQLHRISKGNIGERTNRVTHTTGNALSGMAEQASQRHDGDGVHGKDDGRAHMGCLDGDADRDEHQQDIEPAVQQGGLGMFAEPDDAILKTG